MTVRAHGKTAFAHIQDGTDRLQIYVRQDLVGEEKFNFFQHMIDIGDILMVTGSPFKTKTGETTLKVIDFKLLSKSLYPLPEKFHGLTDVEVRYRQRYLDLISSPETREKFKKRSKIIQLIRDFLNAHEFIEVETPMLHPIPGGAAARPFITHHNTYDMDLYLRIAPELYLKRLVVGGFDRVYEINRNFRNEGVSTRHNPEFTMLEFYMAYQDYNFMMDFVQEMLKSIIMQVNGTLQLQFGDHTIDFEKPFARFSPQDALIHSRKVTHDELKAENIDATIKKHQAHVEDKNSSLEVKIYALFEKLAEQDLIQPTYIIDLPIEVSPLARKDPNNPHVAARFELFVAGMEIANGFNELNDPFDQADRFKEQLKAHERGNVEAHQYDADYIHALEYGMPPTAGCGIGIDRLAMLLTNTTSIKDVILFPTLKIKK
jgi:lysyl-tRNA synthetase class 2